MTLTREALFAAFDTAVADGRLRELDRALVRFLDDQAPGAPPLLLLAAALASHALGRGHTCVALDEVLEGLRDPLAPSALPVALDGTGLAGLTCEGWQAALDDPRLITDGPGDTPLVRSGPRVYLRRYWQYERAVRAALDARLMRTAELQATLPAQALRHALDTLFAADTPQGPSWQKLACALAARSAFGVITGGPGTGKTTTVVRLLALLQHLAAQAGGRPLRIRLAAPTGKAAARLNESIRNAVATLPLPQLVGAQAADALHQSIPTEVTTLHRLLGSRPDTRRFRHHAGQPLPLDVLVVDEASMIDLEMMAAVLDALPPQARLVLLGDRDQLASVEAGAVLGELCARARRGHYTPATAAWLAEVAGASIDPGLIDPAGTPLDQAVAMLRHSHRFDAGSGIGQLAAAVNAGQPAEARRVLGAGRADVARLAIESDPAGWEQLLIDGRGGPGQGGDRAGYRHYLEVLHRGRPSLDAAGDSQAWDRWAREVLAAFAGFQLLCAVRAGPWGVEGLNARIAALLMARGLIPAAEGWYPGRPVLVTRNDYSLGLMNGDVGIALMRPRGPGEAPALRVAFPSSDGEGGHDGGVRWVLPSRLQAVETVYAMTVHKSQGSEFNHAALVLPPEMNPVLTRELVYTGITRARTWFTLAEAAPGVFERAIVRRVRRVSGLLEAEAGED